MGEIKRLGGEGEEKRMTIHMRDPVAVLFGVKDREVCGWKKMTVLGKRRAVKWDQCKK